MSDNSEPLQLLFFCTLHSSLRYLTCGPVLNAVSGAVGHVFRTLLSLLSGVQSWAAVHVSAIELYLDIRSTIEDYIRVGNRL